MAEMLCLEMIKTIFVPYFPGIAEGGVKESAQPKFCYNPPARIWWVQLCAR